VAFTKHGRTPAGRRRPRHGLTAGRRHRAHAGQDLGAAIRPDAPSRPARPLGQAVDRRCAATLEAESPRWPGASVVCHLYGDRDDPWNAALVDAGASVRVRRWSDAADRTALAAFWARTGRPPRAGDLRDATWSGPSAQTLRSRYGGVAEAWDALGPAPAENDVAAPSPVVKS
jgi:hypothetical protein